MDKNEALTLSAKTANCCDEAEHHAWWEWITRDVPDVDGGRIIEVGCMTGGGTTTMAAAAQHRGFLVECVDTWFTGAVPYQPNDTGKYPHLEAHINQLLNAGLNSLVARHVGDSKRIGPCLNVPCVFLWIDAAHGYPHPKLDFLAFKHLIVPGGIVGFHDATWQGLPQTFKELEAEGGFDGWQEIQNLPHDDWILPPELKHHSRPCGWITRAWRKNG